MATALVGHVRRVLQRPFVHAGHEI
jgi:hypothetical protein